MVSPRSSSHAARAVALAAFCAFPLIAAAQPANDLCPGAEVIPAQGPFPYVTAVTDLLNATSTEPVPSCQSSVNRGVWYVFTPAQSGTYVLSTCQDQTLTTVVNTVHAVYTASDCSGPFTQVAAASGGCDDNSCVFGSSQSVTSTPMIAGTTYYVLVYRQGATTTTPTAGQTQVQLRVRLVPPGPDTCSAAAALDLDTPVRGSTINAQHDYDLTGLSACFSGVGHTASSAPGRDSVFQFTAPSAGRYSFRLTRNQSQASNMVLYVANSCPTAAGVQTVGTCVGAANRTSVSGSTEEVHCLQMSGGETYYAFADEHLLSSGSTFDVEVTRCALEVEPNNLVTQAGPLSCGAQGSIVPAGDVDFYDVGVAASGYRMFAMIDGSAGSSVDFDLRVTTATTTLEYDDMDADGPFGSTAPVIAGTPLNGQPIFLRASHYSATTQSEPYRLYSVVRSPLAAAVPEVEPNDSVGTATGGGTYYHGALSGPAPSTDADFYSFTATAGDLAFIALDGDPLRDNTPLNAALALLSAAGEMLVQVNDANTTSSATAGTSLTSTTPTSPGEGLLYRIPHNGTYYVRVRAGSTTSTTASAGDYLLSIALNCRSALTAPTLQGVSPAQGSTAGGTPLTLTGVDFLGPVAVRVGANLATNVQWVNATTLSATAPAGPAGPAQVTVFNADAQRSVLPGAFTYVAPPVISSLSPSAVPTSGGATVTINGSNLQPGATIAVGGALVPTLTGSATALSFTAPAGQAGPAPVTVTNPDGQSATASLTYVPPPTVSGVSPASGRTSGGQPATVSGTGFLPGVTVRIGGALGTVQSVSASAIGILTPAGSAGAATVQVENTDGQSAALVDAFTFVPPPIITGLSPTVGGTGGGTLVTVSGQHFGPGALVTFDGLVATTSFVSPSELVAETPGHAPGDVAVTVFNPDGQSDQVQGAFTYVALGPPPTISSIIPNTGTTAGGTTVVITGTGFAPGAVVTLGGAAVASFSYDSETQLTLVTAPRPFGAVDVRVRNPDNQFVLVAGGFTYQHPAVVLTQLAPGSGRTSGNQVVTVSGNHFLTGATVSFGGTAGTAVNVTGATSLTVTTPARAAGTVSLTVTNPDGQVSNGLPFTFVPPPTVSAVQPAHGSTLGGGSFTLTGTGFLSGATVSFGGPQATGVAVQGSTSLTGVLPARAAGVVGVTVTNPDGQAATLPSAFTFIVPPLLNAVNPSSGTTLGGTQVTLSGGSFVSGATVSFGGLPSTAVAFVSATQLVAVAPPAAAGSVDVRVQNPDGQSATLASAFTYFAPPALGKVSPSSGPTAGGTQVTLSGAGFLSGARVLFGSTMAALPSQVTPTQVVVTAPPHVPGTVSITVRNPDGQTSAVAAAYAFLPPPVVTSVNPPHGPVAGGAVVKLGGAGFQPGAQVTLGGVNAEVLSTSAAALQVRTGAGMPLGELSLTVQNPDGQATHLPKAYRTLPPPTVSGITPSGGPTSGGTHVQVAGEGFRVGARVFIGGIEAQSVVFVSGTSLTAVTPAGPAGAAPLRVVNPDGVDHVLPDAFLFQAPPVAIHMVTANSGSERGGTGVLVSGAHFTLGTAVSFGAVPATGVVFISAEVLEVRSPEGRPGMVDVRVTRPDGSSALLASGFRYLAAPDAGAPAPAASDGGAGSTPPVDAGTAEPLPPPGGGCSQAGGSLHALGLLALGCVLGRWRRGGTLGARRPVSAVARGGWRAVGETPAPSSAPSARGSSPSGRRARRARPR
jgi:hypothetical protein